MQCESAPSSLRAQNLKLLRNAYFQLQLLSTVFIINCKCGHIFYMYVYMYMLPPWL